MTIDDVRILLNEQLYDILTEQGYVFLHKNYSYGVVLKDELDNFLANSSKYDPYTALYKFDSKHITSYTNFPNYLNRHNNENNYEKIDNQLNKIKADLCFNFLKENPQLYKAILPLLKSIFGRFIHFYKEYFAVVGFNKEKFIYHFHKMGLTDLYANSLPLHDFFKLTKKHQLNDKESQALLIQFLNNRFKQLKDPLMAIKVRDEFLSYFEHNEEKLSPYFPSFKLLEKSFKQSQLNTSVNIFQQEYEYTAYIQINYATMFKQFLIEGWTLGKYQQSISPIVKGITLFYQLETKITNIKEHNLPYFNITILHNGAHFNQSILKQDIIKFFTYLYNNPTFEITSESVKTWFHQLYLSEKLAEKDVDKVKRTKL